MKKLVSILSLVLGITIVLSGCSSNKNKYTKKEDSIINLANNEINKLYDVKINKDNLEYSVGKQVKKDQYESIKDGEEPEIIAVTTKRFDDIKKGDVLSYSFIYNTKTKEVISSNIEKY